MTIRNWQESDEELSYSWPAAAGIGVLMFAGMMGVGGYTDVLSAQVAAGFTLAFGVFFEWAFRGRDPGQQLESVLTPSRLLTNDELFGANAAGPSSFAQSINSAFSPAKMEDYDKLFGMKPTDLTGLKQTMELFAPKSLFSYDDLGKSFGFGGTKS